MQLTDFDFDNCSLNTKTTKITAKDLKENPKFVALVKREANQYEKEIISKHNEAILKALDERVTGNANCVKSAKQTIKMLLDTAETKFTDVKVLLGKEGYYYDCETGKKLDSTIEVTEKEIFEKYFKKEQYIQLLSDGKAVIFLLIREPLERFKKDKSI